MQGGDLGSLQAITGAFTGAKSLVKPTVGLYMVAQIRLSSGLMEVRLNQNAWAGIATGVRLGNPFSIGQQCTSGIVPTWVGVDFGASTSVYDDTTFDLIYAALKAKYPACALP